MLRGWGAVLANRRFVLFTLAMLGMFALQTQMYLVYPVVAGRITDWGGAVAVLFLSTTVFNLLFKFGSPAGSTTGPAAAPPSPRGWH